MKNDILQQFSSQIYSFGCSSETGFADTPLQIGTELNVYSMDSNFYTNQDNFGGVLAFCSESQINYQSEPPLSMPVKRLACPAYGNDSRQGQEVHITKKTRKRCSPENSETIAERGRVPARRSQKLSDKITVLQKLVSPYGKTDTASVLQEACISIKALQDQIQNLCNEHLAHSDNQKARDENDEVGLRDKGLCLVPVSLSQKVADQDLFSQMLASMSCFT